MAKAWTQAEKIAWWNDPNRHRVGAPIYTGEELERRIPATQQKYFRLGLHSIHRQNHIIPASEID